MEIKIRHPGDPTDWLAVELIPQRGRRKPAFFKVEVTAFGSSVTLFLTQPDVQQLATALEGYLASKA